MPKYAIFDERGLPKAFYDDSIHQQIPENAIQISNEQWLEFMNNQGKRAFVDNEVIDITNKVRDEVDKVWKDKTENEIIQETLIRLKKGISSYTDFHIQQKLSSIDEDLADITSEAQVKKEGYST